MDNLIGSVRGRVPLVATSSLWVAGFQGLFGDPCGVEVVALTIADALALKGKLTVLVDAGATHVEGHLREILFQFRRWAPELRPIVVSHQKVDDDDFIEGLIRAGAMGFMSAAATPEEFGVALENVRDGSLWAPRKVLSRLIRGEAGDHSQRDRFEPHKVTFTPREDEVIQMLVGGLCNREIGAGLGIDSVTVKAHLGRIMRKAGVANRIELTVFALKRRQAISMKRRTPMKLNHDVRSVANI